MPKSKNINSYPIAAYTKLIESVYTTGKTFTSRPYPDKATVTATRFELYGFINACLNDPEHYDVGTMGKSLCLSIRGNTLVVSPKDQAAQIQALDEDLDTFIHEAEKDFGELKVEEPKKENSPPVKPIKTHDDVMSQFMNKDKDK